MTYQILTLDNISPTGLARLPEDRYRAGADITEPDAILVRSRDMHALPVPRSVLAVARAGAGVNNIPVDALGRRGIPVFNAPGANANAVKELVVAGLLLACRNICQGWDFVRRLEGDDDTIRQAVEAGKKRFVGFELPGRTLGVVGLGAIGVQVANAANALGMKVVGFDPDITVQRAWQLSAAVEQAVSLDELFARSEFVTVHVPHTERTRGLVNAARISRLRKGGVLLNFAREGIVDDAAALKALDNGHLYAYVTDFPAAMTKAHPRIIALPHLGASTHEAEENCAVMVAENLRDFLENGNIRHAVNYPEMVMPRAQGPRLAVANANVPNMVGQITTVLARASLNIADMLNRSRGELAFTLVDVDGPIPATVCEQIRAIEGVLSVRVIN